MSWGPVYFRNGNIVTCITHNWLILNVWREVEKYFYLVRTQCEKSEMIDWSLQWAQETPGSITSVCRVQVENLDHRDVIKCREGREINQDNSLNLPSDSLGFCLVLMFSTLPFTPSTMKIWGNGFMINAFRLWVFGHEQGRSPQSNFFCI